MIPILRLVLLRPLANARFTFAVGRVGISFLSFFRPFIHAINASAIRRVLSYTFFADALLTSALYWVRQSELVKFLPAFGTTAIRRMFRIQSFLFKSARFTQAFQTSAVRRMFPLFFLTSRTRLANAFVAHAIRRMLFRLLGFVEAGFA